MDNNADDKKILNWIPTEDWKRPPTWLKTVLDISSPISSNWLKQSTGLTIGHKWRWSSDRYWILSYN